MIKGKDLTNRALSMDEDDGPSSAADPVSELIELRKRIEAARNTREGEERHCKDCFRQGRDAALRMIDGQ
jgi:hypothetical protein